MVQAVTLLLTQQPMQLHQLQQATQQQSLQSRPPLVVLVLVQARAQVVLLQTPLPLKIPLRLQCRSLPSGLTCPHPST